MQKENQILSKSALLLIIVVFFNISCFGTMPVKQSDRTEIIDIKTQPQEQPEVEISEPKNPNALYDIFVFKMSKRESILLAQKSEYNAYPSPHGSLLDYNTPASFPDIVWFNYHGEKHLPDNWVRITYKNNKISEAALKISTNDDTFKMSKKEILDMLKMGVIQFISDFGNFFDATGENAQTDTGVVFAHPVFLIESKWSSFKLIKTKLEDGTPVNEGSLFIVISEKKTPVQKNKK